MLEVVKAEIPDVRTLNAEVDPEFERILAKMVAKNPTDRYQSCQELIDDLAKHPLVAKGGPITLQAKMSAAAATVVGQKTPVSGQRPMPTTTPTPQPLPRATPARAQSVPGGHQSVLQSQAAQKPSTLLPLAIAALLILGLAGGAFAFRNHIPFLQQYLSPATQQAQTPPSSDATFALANPSSQSASTQAPAASGASVPASTTQTNAVASSAPAAVGTQPPTDPRYATQAAANPAPTQAAEAPAARASQVEPLKELAAAQAAQADAPAQRLARANPPPAVIAPPRPHIPTVAVLAAGDSAISEPAEEAIERMLHERGFRVTDQDALPRVDGLLDGGRPRFAAALHALRGRVDAVVFVHARQVGSQQMNYYGQSSTLYTAQLGVRAYSVAQDRMLGPPWSEQVNFTSLNAADQAREAVAPMLEHVSERLHDFRPKGRRE
jgi:serine/threonine-protein kinase